MSKKSAKNSTKEVAQYQTGEHVLGKVRGYPPWPGIITDPSEVPAPVLGDQPTGKKTPFYCVCFFPTGDYAWLHSKDISSLKKHEIESFLADNGKKKNGDLRDGYRIALDPEAWLTARKNRQAKAAGGEDVDDAEVDELHSEQDGAAAPADDDDASTSKKSKTKKRKRESDPDASTAVSSSKAKKAPKAKKESVEPKKKATPSASRAKKNGVKSKAAVESEDDADHEDAEGEEVASVTRKKASPPPAKKAKRDKDEDGDDAKGNNDPQSLKVRDWRHKLQKTFLSNKGTPKADVMPEIDELFRTVEKYEGMTIEQLQFSKIGKVMRHIAARSESDIPRDDEFKFRTRAKALVDRWHQILNSKSSSGHGNGHGHSSPEPTNHHDVASAINGAAQENGAKTEDEPKEGEEAVMEGTKNLDLNGKEDAIGSPVADADGEGMAVEEEDTGAEAGDMSVLADVTMSEA